MNPWVEWAVACTDLGAPWATYVRLAMLADDDGIVHASRPEIAAHGYGVSPSHVTNHVSWLRRHELLEGNVGHLQMLRNEQLGLRLVTPVGERASGLAGQGARGPAGERAVVISEVDQLSGTDSRASALDRSPARPLASSPGWTQQSCFGAIEAIWGPAKSTNQRGRYGKAARTMVEDGLDPSELEARMSRGRKPGFRPGLEWVLGHWGELDHDPPAAPDEGHKRMTVADIRRKKSS